MNGKLAGLFRRLDAIEAKHKPPAERMTIVRVIVRPGPNGPEPTGEEIVRRRT
jgi:hypothetical protein